MRHLGFLASLGLAIIVGIYSGDGLSAALIAMAALVFQASKQIGRSPWAYRNISSVWGALALTVISNGVFAVPLFYAALTGNLAAAGRCCPRVFPEPHGR